MCKMRNRAMSTLLRALLFLCLFSTSRAIWITLPASGPKCVSEEIHTNILVMGDFIIVVSDGKDLFNNSTISLKVTSPYGNSLYHAEKTSVGNFAFTSRESGTYLACFWVDHNEGNGEITVNLDWKIGVAAKDWETVAKKEKIVGVELELKKLEGAVESIHENLIYLRGREAEMRNVNEKTNSRVAWYSIMSLGVCIAVSILQLWHLKRYFHKKKLI